MRHVALSFFLLGSLAGFAQSRWTIGLQGAYLNSMARATGNNPDVTNFYSQEGMPSASGGLTVQYGVNAKIKIESGLHLTGIGFRHLFRQIAPSGVPLFNPADQGFAYCRVPVHFKYMFPAVSLPLLKMVQPYAVGGPTLLFRTESAYSTSRFNANWTASTAIHSFLRPGAGLGLGIEKRSLQGDAFAFGVLGQLGFTKLVEADWEYNVNGTVYGGKLINRGNFLAATVA